MLLHPHSAPSRAETFQHYFEVARSSRLAMSISCVLIFLVFLYILVPSSSPLTDPLTTLSSTPASSTPPLTSPVLVQHSALSDSPTSHSAPGLSKRVHLPASTVPHLQQWAVARFEPGSRTERHVHPTLTEVFHVKEGRGRFEFDEGAVRTVGEDDTIAVPAGAYHTVVNDGSDVLVMVYASILL